MFILQWAWPIHDFLFLSIPFSFVSEAWLKSMLVSGDGMGQAHSFCFHSNLLSGKRIIFLSQQPTLEGQPHWSYQTLI